MPRDGNSVYSAPSGTTAVSNSVIESAKYNAFVADLVIDLNTPRPVAVGGTGATSAAGARAALGLSNWFGAIPELSAAGALDELSTIGVHYVASANCTTVGGPTGGGDGIVYTGYASAGAKRVQEYSPVNATNPSPWRRAYTSAVWTAWRRDFDFGESGNETWERHASGLQICRTIANFQDDSTESLRYDWTFSVGFSSLPTVHFSLPLSANFANCNRRQIVGPQVTGSATTAIVRLLNVAGQSALNNASIENVSLTAIGRWFEV